MNPGAGPTQVFAADDLEAEDCASRCAAESQRFADDWAAVPPLSRVVPLSLEVVVLPALAARVAPAESDAALVEQSFDLQKSTASATLTSRFGKCQEAVLSLQLDNYSLDSWLKITSVRGVGDASRARARV